jgi:hypothetical protein
VSAQLLHEGVAEATDLVVGLALGVEVGTTLTTTHVHWKLLLASEYWFDSSRYNTYSQ